MLKFVIFFFLRAEWRQEVTKLSSIISVLKFAKKKKKMTVPIQFVQNRASAYKALA